MHAKQWEGFSFNFISKRGSCQKSDARAAVAPGTENPQVRQGLTVQRSPSIALCGGRDFSFNLISKRGCCQKSDARAAVAPGTENPQ